MSARPLLLRHLAGESIGRFPVWMMRQAGRYLPAYRALREKHSFWEMVTTPELARRVSLLPLEVLPTDAIIFFSDILTLPYGMGVKVEMRESVGPVILEPLRDEEAFSLFERFEPARHTGFVGEALRGIRSELSPEIALLGFAGAPWTVACYLVEGRANRDFSGIKQWMHRDPASLARALGKLAAATLSYLRHQVKSGAQVVQLFDTWLSEMPRAFFTEHYLPVINRLFEALKSDGAVSIYFSKRSHHLWGDFARLKTDILSIDELVALREAERETGGRFSLQGNLDPVLLLGEPSVVRRRTRLLVSEARELARPAILNLGHGVTPGARLESVKAFFEEALALWI